MKKFKKCTFQNYLINKVVPFEIAESIPFSERAALVKSIVDSVIKDGEFAPYMKHMSLIFGLCMAYTNLELNKMPIEEVHDLIENSNLGEVLWDNIERNQYSEIVDWVDSMIEYEKQKTMAAIVWGGRNGSDPDGFARGKGGEGRSSAGGISFYWQCDGGNRR